MLLLKVKKIKKAVKALMALDLSPVSSIDKRKIIEIIAIRYFALFDLN